MIEVKTRLANHHQYTPLDQLTVRKKEKLQELVERLLLAHALDFRRRRIRSVHLDFIGIDIKVRGLIPRYTIVWLPDILLTNGISVFYHLDLR